MLKLPQVDSKASYLDGFWQWVHLLARDDYAGAVQALYWSGEPIWTPAVLKTTVTTFFGGPDPWHVVVPNARLVQVINDAADFQPQNQDGWGWFRAQIPLTTEPEDPMNDEILLMGFATSFYVRQQHGAYVMEFEIWHL